MTAAPTGWIAAVSKGTLHGLSLTLTTPLTFLLDPDAPRGDGASAQALRLLAGWSRPSAGTVRVFGRDPADDPGIRRSVALLGDTALLPSAHELPDMLPALAAARGLAVDSSWSVSRAKVDADARLALADRLANPSSAKLLLVRHPELRTRDALASVLAAIEAAVARGALVVISTSTLDRWLGLARQAATAAVISGGRVVAAGEAHGIPWAIPLDGTTTRAIEVSLEEDPPALEHTLPAGQRLTDDAGDAPSQHRAPPSARLAASLLSDPVVAPVVASIEPAGRLELRVHARDVRVVARAIARHARQGVAVRRLLVTGAPAAQLALGLGERRR